MHSRKPLWMAAPASTWALPVSNLRAQQRSPRYHQGASGQPLPSGRGARPGLPQRQRSRMSRTRPTKPPLCSTSVRQAQASLRPLLPVPRYRTLRVGAVSLAAVRSIRLPALLVTWHRPLCLLSASELQPALQQKRHHPPQCQPPPQQDPQLLCRPPSHSTAQGHLGSSQHFAETVAHLSAWMAWMLLGSASDVANNACK